MNKKKVLFICVHNSFRSQIAEAWLNQICGGEFEAQSGGLEAGAIDPLAIEAMREVQANRKPAGESQRAFALPNLTAASADYLTSLMPTNPTRSTIFCPVGPTVKSTNCFANPVGSPLV